MKRVILITTLFFAWTLAIGQASSIQIQPIQDFSLYKVDASIEVNEMDDNLYISMIVGNEKTEGFYTFERSYDGDNFVILTKRSFHAGTDSESRLFTFVSKLPGKSAHYRVYKHIDEEVILLTEYYCQPEYFSILETEK